MEYLLAVVEEESFTRAAHRLSVSQATLSHQLKALEETVGQPLVERLPGRVLPTQMGREYLPHAITALRSAAAARRAVMTGHDGEPVSLRLAVRPLAGLRRPARRHPRLAGRPPRRRGVHAGIP
jgi:Transcriptional regulator